MTSQRDYLVGKINFFRLQVVFSVLLFFEALRCQGLDHERRRVSAQDDLEDAQKTTMLWDLKVQFILSIVLTLIGIAKQLIGWSAFARNDVKLYTLHMAIDLVRGLTFIIYMGGFYDIYRYWWAALAYLSLASFGLNLFLSKCIANGAHRFDFVDLHSM